VPEVRELVELVRYLAGQNPDQIHVALAGNPNAIEAFCARVDAVLAIIKGQME
jgi:hypothetical protein